MNIIISTSVLFISQLLSLIAGYFFYETLCIITPRREGKLWFCISYISCAVLSGMVIFPNDIFNVTLDLVWFILLVLIAFKGSLLKKLASVAVLYPLIISLNFLVSDFFSYLYIWTGRKLIIDLICQFTEVLIHIIFWLIVKKFFFKHLKNIGKLFDDKIWLLLCIVCLASLASITTCIYFSPQGSYKIWICALSCLVTNIGILFLTRYLENSIREKIEQKNIKLQKEYYDELEKNQIEIRKFRHDINNHLSVIKSLLSTENKEEAQQYLNDIELNFSVHNRVFTKNSIVNAVLNAKYNLAQKNNIDCFFNIDIKEIDNIDSVSLCSIFANTLDNAIEACIKISNTDLRKISVKARLTDNNYFSYEISNSKINPIIKKNESFVSNKNDSLPHGLGLINVKEIVEKYNGMIDINYTDTAFTVTILIKLKSL